MVPWHISLQRLSSVESSKRDEVVELEPSFEHLPPVLKPCFPVALRKIVVNVGGDTFGASV